MTDSNPSNLNSDEAGQEAENTPRILTACPAIYLLPTHLDTDDLHELEDRITELGAELTYDITEARIVLGKIATQKRAVLELRVRGVLAEEVPSRPTEAGREQSHERPRKRQRLSTDNADGNSTTEDESLPGERLPLEQPSQQQGRDSTPTDGGDVVRVLKLQWLEDSIAQGTRIDLAPYTIYSYKPSVQPSTKTPPRPLNIAHTSPKGVPKSQQRFAEKPSGSSILERARLDAGQPSSESQDPHALAAPHGSRRMGFRPGGHQRTSPPRSQAKLLEMETEDFSNGDENDMPPVPAWVRNDVKYACQRSTPSPSPNEEFISQLKKIRLARTLTDDEIGVRAYSTSIASLAAYEHKISNPREILRLPGCDVKIANLWIEWRNNGVIKAAEEADRDSVLKNLELFYGIWGVGAATAREYYYEKGWRELDDVVEFGWESLNRVQQIGLKYYEEFLSPIPREEVERIAAVVRNHAIRIRDPGIEVLVVGGYRRGKKESGDVDMIVSHRDLAQTAGLVRDLVESLEGEGWITHTLTLQLTSSQRGQETLPYKSAAPASHAAGFDTLDKALVVWQDPTWPRKQEALTADPKAKNPNIHRRVDIIIAPWRTVGCAVMGWSGGTTFQRDLRRYAKNVRGWKFDSSGVRDRRTGDVVELEGPFGVSGSMVDAEKAVFEGLGLPYREPGERCTG